MTTDILISKQGIAFTIRAVDIMRDFAKALKKDNVNVILWSVTFNRKEEIEIGLAGNYNPHPLAISDQVADVVFEWHAEPKAFDAIRPYCIDAGGNKPSRLIERPDKKPK